MAAMSPTIAAIVPARDAAATVAACVSALRTGVVAPLEVIVVDDGSRDRTAAIAREAGADVISRSHPGGPAAARNAGAALARGDVLLFVDADVIVRPDTVETVQRAFAADAELAAVFGSYDARPASPSIVSQFKNLAHHFVHQDAREDTGSFWAGCGAIRRDVFLAVGGFDADRYPRPSIEDIELGARLWRARFRVRLLKTLQVQHLKRWTLVSLVRSDVRDRAYPWGLLLLDGKAPDRDLNVSLRHRIAALAAWLLVCSVVSGLFSTAWPTVALAAGLALLVLTGLNARFYAFLRDVRGPGFLAAAIPLHVLYYLYSSATFAVCLAMRWSSAGGPSTADPRQRAGSL